MQQNGLGNTQQLWFDGYDRTTLEANAPLMQHTHFLVQHVPFEAASAFPGKFPGLQTYLAAMKKYEPKYTYNEVAMDGWLSAALFAQGVKAAGSDLTQRSSSTTSTTSRTSRRASARQSTGPSPTRW